MVTRRLMGWLTPQRLVLLALRVRPNSEFIIFRQQRLTRGQVFAECQSLASGLRSLGVKRGDRVVTLLPACPEAVYTMFLPALLGTVNVPLNPLLGEHELAHILADCKARMVITTSNWYGQDYPALLERLLPGLPHLQHVIVRDWTDADGDGTIFLPLRQVMAGGHLQHRTPAAADELTAILYTSGTTGLPKGVMHVRSGPLSLASRATSSHLNLSPLRCLLLPFPPYQYAGQLGLVATLLAGGKVILMDRLDPQRMVEHIEEEKVTQIGASPTVYRLLLRLPGQERADLSSIQRITFSTEPCPPDLA
ncbi:MAG TPA: AMP-binding protein, partial [Anaerolineae bacterium]|nr:AMP-binding protein [Anaerolineae bacterium]